MTEAQAGDVFGCTDDVSELRRLAREHSRQSGATLRGYMDICESQSSEIASLRSRVEALEARLEITHAWRWDDASEELVRYEIPAEQRATFPDGIACRDATIALGDEQFKRLKVIKTEQAARIEALEAALAPFVAAFDRHKLTFAMIPDAYADRHILEGEMKLSDLRRADSVLSEKQP